MKLINNSFIYFSGEKHLQNQTPLKELIIIIKIDGKETFADMKPSMIAAVLWSNYPITLISFEL